MQSTGFRVAEVLASHPDICEAIATGGREWIRANKITLRRAAAAAGVLIDGAIRADLSVKGYTPAFGVTSQMLPPTSPVACDVIVPFYAGDAQFLGESMASIAAQQHAQLTVHLIADGCEFPEIPEPPRHVSVRRYQTPGQWGPYRITNAVVAGGNHQTEHIAIHDVDDIMLPDRIWRHVVSLQHLKADMISSAMEQFLDSGSQGDLTLQSRLRWHRILQPGAIYTSVPLGHSVNSTRTMRAELFEGLNGFADARCSMDFEYCNRARYTGARVVDDSAVLSRRRLHSASLTGGPFADHTQGRATCRDIVAENLKQLQALPTIETARRFGSLDQSPKLRPI